METPTNLSLLRSLEINKFTKVPVSSSANAHATVRDATRHWVALYRNLGWVIAHIGRQGFVDLHWEVAKGVTETKSLGEVLLTSTILEELAANPQVLWVQDWDTRSPLWLETCMKHGVSGAHSRALVLDYGEPVWAGSTENLLDIEDRRKN